MLSFVAALCVSVVSAQQPAVNAPANPSMTPITCGQVTTGSFTGPTLSLSLTMAYRGDVTFYLQSAPDLQFSKISALDLDTNTPLGFYDFVPGWKQGYLSIPDQPAGKQIKLELTGTGTDMFWAFCQCTEITPAPTTAPPTPPPTPLSPSAIRIGKQRCGAGMIGEHGKTPKLTGTISLEIDFDQPAGHMALYVNGLKAKKLRAYLKQIPMPLAPAFGAPIPPAAPASTLPSWKLIGETTREGTQFLYLPSMRMGDTVLFHIDLEGTGKYYAVTNCVTPSPTLAPTTPMPTTAMPTPEITMATTGAVATPAATSATSGPI